MCGRYLFSGDNGDSKMKALIDGMEKKYPGAYKTGEIFPGDTAPAMIAVENKILSCPAVFGFPGFQNNQLLINARSETAARSPCIFWQWDRAFIYYVNYSTVVILCLQRCRESASARPSGCGEKCCKRI